VISTSVLDLDRAVDMVFVELDWDPHGEGVDVFGIWCRSWSHLVRHPRLQAFYTQQDKWLPYLAARLSEYAEPE
jgi:hypothetical protein